MVPSRHGDRHVPREAGDRPIPGVYLEIIGQSCRNHEKSDNKSGKQRGKMVEAGVGKKNDEKRKSAVPVLKFAPGLI